MLFSRRYDGDYTRGLYIVDLYVRPEFRARGTGTQLLRTVAGVARSEGVERLAWDVHPENEGAIGFYRSLGGRASTDAILMYLDVTEVKP